MALRRRRRTPGSRPAEPPLPTSAQGRSGSSAAQAEPRDSSADEDAADAVAVLGVVHCRIQEQRGERLALTVSQCDRLGEPIGQQEAVRQASQRIELADMGHQVRHEDGRPLDPDNWARRVFPTLRKAAKTAGDRDAARAPAHLRQPAARGRQADQARLRTAGPREDLDHDGHLPARAAGDQCHSHAPAR